jgi:hypothetical protein
MTKNEMFFDKLEKETFELLQFKEHLVENHFPQAFEEHEIDYFNDRKILKLEEDLVVAKDIIEKSLDVSEKHKNIVDFLEKLLDEFYKMKKMS